MTARRARRAERASAEERRRALAAVPLFAELSRRQLQHLAGAAVAYRYEPGEVMVKEGAPGETLFVLLEGSAKVVKGGRTIRRLGPSDFFGEVAVMDGRPRSASVVAESPIRCVVLHRDQLKRAMDEEPLVAWKLLQVIAARIRGD
jgi:CRP/FNR family transcriptional regulator, cyclic AMP receptor protein